MADSTPSKFAQKQDEPLFMAIPQTDSDFQSAYARAAATLPQFIEHIQRGGDVIHSAKLRFRDPDASERLREDRFAFLWLTGVQYHPSERVFSGAFFEVPPEFHGIRWVSVSLSIPKTSLTGWLLRPTVGSLAVTRSG